MVAYMDKLIGRLVAKLDEHGLRENTLIVFLGDNGTGREVTTQFQGKAYPGGKGLTNRRGTHVPLIANWPEQVPSGRVNRDLVDSTDFLPTLCELAGVEVPPSLPIDGQSFAPQLRGEKGTPREWLYAWYARNGGAKATQEWAMTTELKVYRDGNAFDLRSDPDENHPVEVASLSGEDAATAKKLQAVMDKYADARPAHLLTATGGKARGDEQAKKRNGQRAGRKRQQTARPGQ